MLSRKYYKEIAAIIKSNQVTNNQTCANIAGDFCQFFASDNPKFNREKFLAACGFDPKA